MGHGRGLRHPEPLLELGHGGRTLLEEVPDEGGAEGRGAARDELDGGEVVRLHRVVRGEEAHQRRHQVQQRGLVRYERLD